MRANVEIIISGFGRRGQNNRRRATYTCTHRVNLIAPFLLGHNCLHGKRNDYDHNYIYDHMHL